MEIVFEVPDDRVAFMLELLRSLDFVGNARPRLTCKRRAQIVAMDTTEYLLSSEANAEHLRRSIEQLERGEVVQIEIPKG